MGVTIIAGSARGRPLVTVPGLETRVATSMLRTSLFDILRLRLEGAAVLDLFAGIGSFGLEALSRGAARATFVERNPACLRAIRENLAKLGFEGAVIRGDAFRYPAGLDSAVGYDIVFVDPPYAEYEFPRVETLVKRLRECDSLAAEGVLVLKHPKRQGFPGADDTRNYGGTQLSFYSKKAPGV
ncbi:MAG TPA: RsmD family RNA methyltransferase [Planctomycetota bacterium]|nr:RsmD family RNA methyltransferase [Planctomycetota bacterium]